jgi:hypothetical protein
MQSDIEKTIDSVCMRGCDAVNAIIRALEQGQTRSEFAALGEDQRRLLLAELRSIMNVYNARKA